MNYFLRSLYIIHSIFYDLHFQTAMTSSMMVSLKVINLSFNEYLHNVFYRFLGVLIGDPLKIKSVQNIFI